MKKILKRITSISLVALMSASLSACGAQKKEVQRYAWPLGTSSPEDTVTQIYAEKFADEVSKLSNGTMKIQVYPNSVLGGDRELLESCKDGDIPFVIQNTAPQVTFMPDIAVFDMPRVYNTIDEVRQAVDNPTFLKKIEKVYEEAGYDLLGYADQGFRVMSTNTKINTIDDFKGQKIRTMENSYHMAFWKALNASPTPMTFSEVYIGLQQGTIDAEENPYEVIVSGKIYEQQDYVIKTNHLPHLLSMIVNEEFYNRLSEDDQKIINQAANNARDYAREQCDERVNNRLQIIKESGTQEIELSDELIQEMREASQSVYDSIHQQVGDELFEAYTKNMNRGE